MHGKQKNVYTSTSRNTESFYHSLTDCTKHEIKTKYGGNTARHLHSADGLYPGQRGTTKARRAVISAKSFYDANYVYELTTSEAQARATPLVNAYTKGVSPGTVLLDDEVDSSLAPTSGDDSCEHQI